MDSKRDGDNGKKSNSLNCFCWVTQWVAIGAVAVVFAYMYNNLISEIETQQQLQTTYEVSQFTCKNAITVTASQKSERNCCIMYSQFVLGICCTPVWLNKCHLIKLSGTKEGQECASIGHLEVITC